MGTKDGRTGAPLTLSMADLIRALESDLFGSYEWSVGLYEDLANVPEPHDRALVWAGLLRAYEGLERPDDATRAAEAMVAAQEATPVEARGRLDALESLREALLATSGAQEAEAFIQAFDPMWAQGPRELLVPDAILACLARSNVLATHRKKPRVEPGAPVVLGGPSGPEELHAWSARTWEAIGKAMRPRIQAGETVWSETAASAAHRAVVAWRLAGDEERARQRAAEAPPVDPADF